MRKPSLQRVGLRRLNSQDSGGGGSITLVQGVGVINVAGGAGPTVTVSHAASGVGAGAVAYPSSITFDADGHATAATAGSAPVTYTGTAPINVAGSVISLNDSGITAGAVAYPTSITFDAKGRATAATAGSAPVTYTGTAPINVAGSVISLNDSGITAGAVAYPTSITFDAKGRATAATAGSAPVTNVTGTSPVTSTGGATPAVGINNSGTSAGRAGVPILIDYATVNGVSSYTTPTWAAGAYREIRIVLKCTASASGGLFGLRVNGDTGLNYGDLGINNNSVVSSSSSIVGTNTFAYVGIVDNHVPMTYTLEIRFFPLTDGLPRTGRASGSSFTSDASLSHQFQREAWFQWTNTASDVTNLTILNSSSANMTNGHVEVWGVPA